MDFHKYRTVLDTNDTIFDTKLIMLVYIMKSLFETNIINTMTHYHSLGLIYENRLSPKYAIEEFKI